MVDVRHRSIISHLPADARHVVEVGCGADLLLRRLPPTAEVTKWIIVEPDDHFVAMVTDDLTAFPFASLITGTIEDSVETVLAALDGRADAVICSSLLHEVADPPELLAACLKVMSDNAALLVNVPNAGSLHRRLAVSAGLIDDVYVLSSRNHALRQQSVFDRATLAAMLDSNGLRVISDGGYFLKPFTHQQMAQLAFLDDEIIVGLSALGAELPDLASEIYAIAVPKNDSHA